MEEVRQLVQEEGREARNLVTFHVAVDSRARVSRKPPRYLTAVRQPPAPVSRLRSASAGRDKRSELRARYWALLFGDLQRAIGEIYNTVEVHENPNECQEVILVLENYTRDFKALGEWFRLKWEYDNTPPPQRPQSLAWEIRKTDFVRLEPKRTVSVKTSPTVSGKNSPCLSGHNTPSGKNSPNLTGKVSPGSGKVSPRVANYASTSPKANIEFFSNKIAGSKITAKSEARLSDIKEKETKDISVEDVRKEEPQEIKDITVEGAGKGQTLLTPIVEIGKAKECANVSPKPVIIKYTKSTKSSPVNENQINNDVKKDSKSNSADNINNINQENDESNSPVKSDDNFADISNESSNKLEADKSTDKSIASSDHKPKPVLPEIDIGDTNETIKDRDKCNDVYNSIVKDTNELTHNAEKETATEPQESVQGSKATLKLSDGEVDINSSLDEKQQTENKDDYKKDHEFKKLETKTAELKAVSKPAYSQAAAKPKTVTPTKTEVKTPTKTITSLTRSKTVVEMRPNVIPKTLKQFTKKNQASKCSYPFNLTTGRTSLFDTALANKGTAPKKPLAKHMQMAAGDAKPNTLKTDLKDQKKRPPRPTSLKITEKGDRKDKLNRSLGNIKNCDDYSSTDTVVTQIDMSRIESSESLKTLVPDDLQAIHDVGSSIEVLNVDNKSDNEGWLTVKSKRVTRESKKQSKSHWANRFNQPSATTSLPTLNMMESPKQENSPLLVNEPGKQDRAKSEQPQNIDSKPEQIISKIEKIEKEEVKETENTQEIEKVEVEKPRKTEKAEKPDRIKTSRTKSEVKVKIKDLSMIRQKSDVTGLKTRSARSKALNRKSEKANRREESKLTKNRLHSSLESLTTGLARSQESTEDAFDFDKWKEEFKSTFKYLDEDDQMTDHNEILKTADPSEMSEIAEMTSLIEENERKISLALDFQTDVDQQKLCEEEDSLNRQIMELQQGSDIDLDTETDDTETDAEIASCGAGRGEARGGAGAGGLQALGSLAARLEHQYELQLEGMSWAERVDTLGVLEALVARDPGRAQQLHAKLSQGIKRRGSLQDALRRLQAKQARAERQRLELQTERSKKIHQLLARVEEVKVAKNQLIEEKRLRMERRLQKAAENRDQHLKDIVRKAHDEEEKLREIAFITELQQQNRRHEFVTQCMAHTSRLRAQRRDRLTRLEQKAAREAAVGARRLALEEARALHVQTLLVRSRERGARGQTMREMKRQERGDAAREKAEGVKSRLSALAAAAELEADALRERIRDKQDASQQRLESRLRAIRDRAANRVQTLSESQEQEDIEEEAARLERERKEREKQKAIKKKARKIRQKLLSIGNELIPSTLDNNPSLFVYDPFTTAISNKMHKSLEKITSIIEPVIHGDAPTPDEYTFTNNETKKIKKQKKMANGDAHKNNCQSQTSDVKSQTSDVKSQTSDVKSQTSDVKSDIDNNNDVKEEPKRKKKRNRDVERAKLSKTNSVCSSLSDMSKNSGRSENRGRSVVDCAMMERHLNELHRILERIDKLPEERLSCEKVHTLEVAGHVLALADDNHEFAQHLSNKCLTLVVSLRSRLCTFKLIGHLSDSVHLVSILNRLMDKDLSDISTQQLIKQVCDSLSLSVDRALSAIPSYRPKARQHAHYLISYLCLTGCIAKAENLVEIRDSIQTLLTVIADVCRPSEEDTGSDRAAAAQSLRIALGSSLCGSRAVLCALFSVGAVLEHCAEFVKAARTAHLLKLLAVLDHVHVQESFGEGGWPLEFRAAVSRLLTQHAPNDKHAPGTGIGQYYNKMRLDQHLSETMVLDLIELVGYVVVNNPVMQETILPGWNVVKILCTLPANWLVSEPHSHALLPTLLALAEHEPTRQVISAELSYKMLEDFYHSTDAKNIKLIQIIKQARSKKISHPGKK